MTDTSQKTSSELFKNAPAFSTKDPAWSINNPYLNILSPRFFSDSSLRNWSDLPMRVGRLFLRAEIKYSEYNVALDRAKEIIQIIHEGAFFPNSPVMMNSESESSVNLFACHVLAPPVNIDDFSIAKHIHDGCGGIGYDFSKINDPVSATLTIEKQTELLNPTRKRKAHSAVTLHYKHSEIINFIKNSSNLTITHINVELDDDFFNLLTNNDCNSVELWNILCNSIHETGRPSISFESEKAKRSRTKLINNVCGESLLRENESSLIGSINLTKFITNAIFDFDKFQTVARLGLLCLDNLHDIQDHASPIVQKNCLESRKVGIGVMGYSDALLLMGIRYGSIESLHFIEKLMSLLKSTLIHESEHLGRERGFCNPDLISNESPLRRNASLMAIPANGTLSLIANVSGGIEPIFTYLIKQKIQDTVFYQLQPTFKNLLAKNNIDIDFVFNELMSGKSVQSIDGINSAVKATLVTANQLTTEEHILTQAKFQGFIDGGISKTINLPKSATVNDIKNAILFAKQKFCVGVSLYRNGSLQNQPTQSVN